MKQIYTFLSAACLMLLLSTEAHSQQTTTNYGLIIDDITLQRTGNRMEVDFTIFIEGLKIRSNRSLRITPCIMGSDDMMQLPAVIIDGRRRHIVHARQKSLAESADTYIRRYNRKEQIIDYQTDVQYEEWMGDSELILREEWISCHDRAFAEADIPVATYIDPSKKAADALAASKQAQKSYIIPAAKASAATTDTIDIFFPVNSSTISSSFMDNNALIAKLGEELKGDNIKAIHLMGYASPEGGYAFNTDLAMRRAEAVKKHLAASNLSPDIEITTQDAPIDWQELKQWLTESMVDNNRDIVAIIDNADIKPADKNRVIRERYPVVYEFMLGNWYPKLRKTAITIDCKPMSIDEAKAQMKADPKSLSLEDMYMVALSYRKGSKEYNDIILLAAENYPQSVEARINAANVAMDKGDYQQAGKYLSGIPANNPQAMNSRGILAMSQGKYQEAMQLFQSAEQAGVSEVAYNISLLKKLIAADK